MGKDKKDMAEEVCLQWIEANDHRSISTELMNAITEANGALHEFLICVQAHNRTEKRQEKKLAMLLRGNSDSVVIYYRNHMLWKLSLASGRGKVEFNFDHARYEEEWKNHLKILQKQYQMGQQAKFKPRRNHKGEITGGTVGYISAEKDRFDKAFVEYTHDTFIRLIDSFFGDANERKDYFKAELGLDMPGSTRFLIEKIWQHRLFFHFNDEFEQAISSKNINGTFIYDLEFSQPFPNKESRDILGKNNEPDMLGIKFENGMPKSIQLIEVKSTAYACEGKSGIEQHVAGMRNYANNKRLMKCRAKDLIGSLKQYAELGLFNGDKALLSKVNDFCGQDNIDVELIIVLTNNNLPGEIRESAIDYYKNNEENVNSWLKNAGCRLQIVEGDYFEDKLDVKNIEFD